MKVEGKNAVVELFRSNTQIDKVIVQNNAKSDLQNIIALAQKKHVKISYAPKEALDRESTVKNHQGIIAYVSGFSYSSLDEILNFAKSKKQNPFILLCDKIADPHNLGSLIRTCECAGVHGIVIPKNRACQINDTVIKVSTGACFNVKIACVTNLNDTIRWLKERDVFVYSLEADGTSIYDTDLTNATALVIGSEGFGLKQIVRNSCDLIASIPLFGKVNSLNASVAAGVVIYEAVRQRRN